MGRSLPGRAQARQRESAKSTEPQIPVCVYSTGQRTTACRPGSALCLFSCGLQGKSGFYTSFNFNFFFFLNLAIPHGTQDPSSLTQRSNPHSLFWKHGACIGSMYWNHWTTRGVLTFLNSWRTFHNTWKLYEIQILASINERLLELSYAH